MSKSKFIAPQEISPEVQLQLLWFTASRQGRNHHLPRHPLPPIYRHLSLSDVCGVIFWVLLVTATLVFSIWTFVGGGI